MSSILGHLDPDCAAHRCKDGQERCALVDVHVLCHRVVVGCHFASSVSAAHKAAMASSVTCRSLSSFHMPPSRTCFIASR